MRTLPLAQRQAFCYRGRMTRPGQDNHVFGMGLALVVLLMVSSGNARADDNNRVPRVDVDAQLRVTIDLPEDMPSGAPAGTLHHHTVEVRGVVKGQRIPLPRGNDGRCRTDAIVEAEGMRSGKVEIDPDRQHWTVHEIETTESHRIDEDTCEVVVIEASERERVRRRVVRHARPGFVDHLLTQPPAPGSEPVSLTP